MFLQRTAVIVMVNWSPCYNARKFRLDGRKFVFSHTVAL